MRTGTHGSSVGIVAMIGVLSPTPWPSSRRALGVELGGHEHRAARGVEVEHLGGVGRSRKPLSSAHAPTSSPPPASTVMSRASICVSRMISTSAASAAAAAASAASAAGGATSCGQALEVQSPPRSTLVGTSGSGMIDPTASPSPVNSNDVT